MIVRRIIQIKALLAMIVEHKEIMYSMTCLQRKNSQFP